MANPTTPFGLIPVRTITGAPWNAKLVKCYVPSTYSTIGLFVGDPVVLTGDSDTPGHCPTIGIATGGSGYPIFGVIASFEVDPTNLENFYRVNSTARYAYVVTDPDVVYQVMVNGTLTTADIGANAVLSAQAAGSTVTGQSGWSLYYATTPAASAAYQVSILKVADIPNNTIGLNCVVEVTLNLSTQRAVYIFSGASNAWAGTLGV